MKSPTPLRPRRGKPARKKASALRVKPERDPAYRAFVRGFACVTCNMSNEVLRPRDPVGRWAGSACDHIEAAHMGAHGIAQKASDYTCIPLCAACHRLARDSAHRLGRKFAEHHGLDIPAIQAELRALYEKERKA